MHVLLTDTTVSAALLMLALASLDNSVSATFTSPGATTFSLGWIGYPAALLGLFIGLGAQALLVLTPRNRAAEQGSEDRDGPVVAIGIDRDRVDGG